MSADDSHGNRAESLAGPPGLAALMRNADAPAPVRPVELWDPPYCGDIGMKIRRDGVWVYQGSPIGRPALVKLFASVLRKDENGRTHLVTPAEKVDVEVEDAPFLAVELRVSGAGQDQVLSFRTNVDDVVNVGCDHPLRFVEEAVSGGLKPYVHVRGRLEALATRAVYAEIASLALSEPADGVPGVWSGGIFWPMLPA